MASVDVLDISCKISSILTIYWKNVGEACSNLISLVSQYDTARLLHHTVSQAVLWFHESKCTWGNIPIRFNYV